MIRRPLAQAAAHAALLLCLHPLALLAQQGADTLAAPVRGALRADTVWSQSLGTHKRLVVYLPPAYAADTTRRFPVLFYLHGRTGGEDDWIRQARLDRVMDSLVAAGAPDAIVVMPDGDDSWYTTWHTLPNVAACRADTARREPADTYCVPWPHYDDYVARDLVAHVDGTYRTLATAKHRGIAGLSMGGFGAVTLALRYPDVFSAAASHSGVLAPALLGPRPFAEPARWARTPEELREAAGRRYGWYAPIFGPDTIGWYARDPGRLVGRLVTAGTPVPALYVDCGLADDFLDQNRAFITTLRAFGLSHRYHEHSGGHDWNYWRTHLPTSLTWLLDHVGAGLPEALPAETPPAGTPASGVTPAGSPPVGRPADPA